MAMNGASAINYARRPVLIDPFTRILDYAPIWVIGFLVLVSMIGAAAAGRWVARLDRHRAEDDASGSESFIVSGVLGLLALLVGFTYSLSVERYETRRGLVLAEANAIGTAYLRSQLLDAPHRERMSAILTEYAENRLVLAEARGGDDNQSLVVENDRLLTRLWREMVAAYPGISTSEFSGSLIESINAVIDLDAARKAARDVHVPSAVFLLLFVYQASSAGVLGYVLAGPRSLVLTSMLLALFTLSLLLVIDIDRPMGGQVRESQRPMQMLVQSLAAQPPEVFGRATPSPSGDEAADES